MSAGTCQWRRGCTNQGGWLGYCHRHYLKLRRTNHLRGGFINPTPAQARIQKQVHHGRAVADLAHLSGVSRDSLYSILAGRYPRIRVGIADKIMAVPMRPSDVGCVRRVRALRRGGYGSAAIAAAAGVTQRALEASVDRGTVTDPMSTAVAAVYEQLSGTPGPSRLASRKAEIAGYPPPFAWEGIDIDDPAATADLGDTTRRSSADLVSEYRHLRRNGVSHERALRQLGVKNSALEQARHRSPRTTTEVAA